jgi:hypothetical protein
VQEENNKKWAFLLEWSKKNPNMRPLHLALVLEDDLEEFLDIYAWNGGRSHGKTFSS